MEWSLERVREMVAGGMQSVRECESSAVGTAFCLLLLFVWYCYRVGREHSSPPLRGGYSADPGRGGGPGSALISPEVGGRGKGRQSAGVEEQNGFAYCHSPECFRCIHAGEGLNQRLYHSLQDYAKRYTWAGMGRVHKGVRDQGRYLSSRPSIQKPEVFFLPDLPSAPFFSREAQKHDVELLERSFPALLAEFESVYHHPPARTGSSLPPGWKANSTPHGQWWTFYLVNQGTPLALNARRCPRAWRVLGQLRTFIANNVFGNACFSVLSPGALITEHYGPTNVRLRCHLGLRVPSGCELVVGGEPQCWSEGSCLLFDDSFLHTAFHEGSPEDGPRVVFMVDLWHPNVAAAERQALDYIFTPGR
ncbi:aspartate beta-hydroxylase domain-containing protein 2 [Megalops cyprinoides]|uniref:aspartate beta-hydroxylase domain-containing protein 2 n=1 Tax=Megalops cyprinoides TaxID=118141 RepID=UPI00186504D3|nr:aspartate beta-hydroxylase domain-containing protein 2 [Megalops cyprinoides]XP_036382888.1 aspartate beta-hydroxylase domain-containing protein 2 [Megalops cyprinoides]XP_036382889.1 aspartate beta-hydroxylase domain-containing protein 2 [Megalops cyprinoides]XP_036382890.1 aspartate beta-hydroxylase domain-containing protein 2 [Megalops cyprinoides]XP_036382891.1 aspartate beta-hydroxylase domain-containing protein 2 [Megalops cyprinoides]XP_036382892.1 aspartate beta-hydroxylase domain-c